MNTPIEAIEQYYPVLFEQYELRPGTGGRGKWRGGYGLTRAWRLIGSSAEVTVVGERQKIPPWALEGGQPGGLGTYSIRRANRTQERIKSKGTLHLTKGDTLIIKTPGGGGYCCKTERKKKDKAKPKQSSDSAHGDGGKRQR